MLESHLQQALMAKLDAQLTRCFTESNNFQPPPEKVPAIQRLQEMLDTLCPVTPRYVGMVLRPAVLTALRDATRPKSSDPRNTFAEFAGITLYDKNDQVADCLAFTDIKLLRAYLAGTITEQQLADRINPQFSTTKA